LFQLVNFISVRCILWLSGGLGVAASYNFGKFITWLLRDVVHYRKSTIKSNLNACFVGFNTTELNRIIYAYYSRLGELVAENARIPYMSVRTMRNASPLVNPELLDMYYDQGKSVMVIMGHLGNWEWAGLSAASRRKHKICAAYKPLKNPYFDRYLKKLRSRFNMHPVPISAIPRHILGNASESPVCYTFIADQSPPKEQAEWIRFLHRDTPFFHGWAKLAQKTNLPVIYASSKKIDRGKYQVTFHEISGEPATESIESLVHTYARLLERDILQDIPSWLWSHKRWKHSRPVQE